MTDRCRHRNPRATCPDCTPGRLMSPVPQRPAGPYCSRCGLTGGHDESDPVRGWHFGCMGTAFGDDGQLHPIPLRDPGEPPARPWVDAALAYGGDAA